MGRRKRKQPKRLSGKLKQIRLDSEWTQEQLARRLKVDSGAISRYERGIRVTIGAIGILSDRQSIDGDSG